MSVAERQAAPAVVPEPPNLMNRLAMLLEEIPFDDESATADHMRGILALDERVKNDAKRLAGAVEAYALGWLRLNGGELRDGNVRYYAAPNKTTKCTNYVGAVAAISRDLVLTLDGLDFDAIGETVRASSDPAGALQDYSETLAERLAQQLAARYLSTSCLKPSACKEPLGAEWPTYFREESTSKLKADGEPEARLQKVDDEMMAMIRKKRGPRRELVEGEVPLD